MRPPSFTFGVLPVVLGVLALFAAIAELPVEFRTPIVLAFLAGGPGAAIVGMLGLKEPLHQLTLSIAMSLVVSSLVSLVSLYAGLWSPTGILIVVVLITIGAVSLQRYVDLSTRG